MLAMRSRMQCFTRQWPLASRSCSSLAQWAETVSRRYFKMIDLRLRAGSPRSWLRVETSAGSMFFKRLRKCQGAGASMPG